MLWDLRFHGDGSPRTDFVLNQAAYAGTRILITGANFGCGSSREHAVWGLQQFGIAAVIAPCFGEIFYSNAMNNRLLAVMVSEADVSALMQEASGSMQPLQVQIDAQALTVRTPGHYCAVTLSQRYRRMFLDGLDMIGASLTLRPQIERFAQQHWASQPWLRDVAQRTKLRLDRSPDGSGPNPSA